MAHGLLTLIGSALLVITALVATASVLVHARVDWRATTMGRHLMLYMSVIAAVFDLSVVRLVLGDSPWFTTLQLVVFVGVPVAMIQRLYLQVQAQRAEREAPVIELIPLDDDDDGAGRP